MRRLVGLVAAACLSLGLVMSASAGNSDRAAKGGVDSSSAIVLLKGDPLSTYVKTKPAPGKKIDFSSSTVKSYRAQLSALRNDFKQWLKANAPAAKVTGEFDTALNAVAVQLNGTSLDTLRSAPQVQSASYEGLYHPTYDPNADPDLSLIAAKAGWDAGGGAANAGAGVKVAIVDTGIDITNPCFSDAGYAPQKQLGDTKYTNNKVIVAKVFQNKTPSRGYTPAPVQEHGTHVAGTVACNVGTPVTVHGVTIANGISGVAPKALLGNYNVFPGDVTNARSEDILDALEAAYADGMDVDNMSLSGGANGIQDLLTTAVDNLDQAGMVSAVAAGNEGPGHFTVGSPGSADRALTAGASTAPHFVGAPITVAGTTYQSATGDFAVVTSDFTAALKPVLIGTRLSNACVTGLGADGAPPAGSLTGSIAVVARGVCTFSEKIRSAQDAGAAVVIVVNNVAGDPIAMGRGGIPNEPTVPAYMVGPGAGPGLIAAAGQPATIDASLAYFVTQNGNIMAGFSSQGPTDVDFRVKPDVVAPGVNVLSSIPAAFCSDPPCFAFFQGTSMATPHLAGSAAVVIGQHPDWSAARVRSAIVNTADDKVLKDRVKGELFTSANWDPNITGAGLENLGRAVASTLGLDPVSVSFGSVPSGSGQTLTKTIALSGNTSGLSVEVTDVRGTGVTYSASVSGSTVTVTATAAKGASAGDHPAMLRLSRGGSEVAHAVLYTFVK